MHKALLLRRADSNPDNVRFKRLHSFSKILLFFIVEFAKRWRVSANNPRPRKFPLESFPQHLSHASIATVKIMCVCSELFSPEYLQHQIGSSDALHPAMPL